MWNELSGIYRLYEAGYLYKVDRFLVLNEPLGYIDEIFPEIPSEKVKWIKREELLEEILDNNYFVITFDYAFIRENLAERVYQTLLKKCSSALQSEVEKARKKHFPILWVSIRLGDRTWVSQVEGIANIIKNLWENFPNLAIVIDGFSLPESREGFVNPQHEATIKREKETVRTILSLLPPEIKVYDTVGCWLHESIVWAHAIDLYLAHHGTIQHKVGWTANKPGVVHTNRKILKQPLSSRAGAWERENGIVPVYVPKDYIVDINETVYRQGRWNSHPHLKNYECDWKGVYEEVLKLALSIKDERVNVPLNAENQLRSNSQTIKTMNDKMLAQRFQRLNALAKINCTAKYLEVGVFRGATFNRVNIPFKVAVDPKFRFNTNDYTDRNTIFHEVTSDEFFAKLASEYDSFDLIYLDGLHTFEQTFRDFCASLRYSHQNTIWLIDDTHPTSLFSADPDPRRARRLQKLVGDDSPNWMGDVYKVVFAIHDFFPQFSYATFPGHGQTVVWTETRKDFAPLWNSLEKISRMKYDDFLEFRDSILKIRNPSEIIKALEKATIDRESLPSSKSLVMT